jgi:hypothetical protein
MEAATNITKAERVKYFREVICLTGKRSHFHQAQNRPVLYQSEQMTVLKDILNITSSNSNLT